MGPKTPVGVSRNKSERERKIGHRRVGVGGEITYKKVSRRENAMTYYRFVNISIKKKIIAINEINLLTQDNVLWQFQNDKKYERNRCRG